VSTTQTRIYLARLAGTAVFDSVGDQVGKIRDVVVTARLTGKAPSVLGFVVEVAPRRRIFVPMARITSIEPGSVVTSGVVNLRRFEGRTEETLVIAELLDRRVKLTESGEVVTVQDIGMKQERTQEWAVSRLFIRKAGSGFGRRGETVTVEWDEVTELFSESEQQPVDSLLASIEEMRPADLANLLQELPQKRRLELISGLDVETLADVFEELPEDDRVEILSELGLDRARDVLEEMDPDDAADLLSELPPEQAEKYLGAMEPDEAKDLRRLLTYDDFSAGGMMTTEPVVLSTDATVAEALARVRQAQLSPALASQVYVTRSPHETPTGKYLGVAHVQRLLREPPSSLVSGVLDSSLTPIGPSAPLGQVARYFATYDLVALPVVDENDHLIGAVTIDDVIDHMLPADWRENEIDEEG
jgi:flagellar motility protein MotE (MotC chaperone)/sporulation protein YlmC with PRC-barrel domain